MKTFKTNDKLRSSEVDSNFDLLTSGEEMHYAGAWTEYDIGWYTENVIPALGDGVLEGRYIRMGRTMVVRFWFAGGVSTTYGSGGAWRFTLPAICRPSTADYDDADAPSNTGSNCGVAYMENAGVLGYFGSIDIIPNVNAFGVLADRADGTFAVGNWCTSTTPFTWATGDFITGTFMYECEDSIV